MGVSYNRLWKLLIDKNMRKKDLAILSGVSSSTITKMGKGENVNMGTLRKICLALNCELEEIVEIKEDIFEKNTL